jgi:hypothetical protein
VRWTVGRKSGLAFGGVALFVIGIAIGSWIEIGSLAHDQDRLVAGALPHVPGAERARLTRLDATFHSTVSTSHALPAIAAIVGSLLAGSLATWITLALRMRVRRARVCSTCATTRSARWPTA